jgi:hypothetical protein
MKMIYLTLALLLTAPSMAWCQGPIYPNIGQDITTLYDPVAPETYAFSGGAALMSKYIWRGVNLNDDVVLQPDLALHLGAFTGGLWASLDTTDDANDDAFEFTETRYFAEYGAEISEFELLFGYIFYHRFGVDDLDQTSEIFASARLADYIIEPALTIYQDIDAASGTWIVLSANYIDNASAVPWRVDASIGYGTADFNEFYYHDITSPDGVTIVKEEVDSAGVTDITFGGSADWVLYDGIILTPFVNITILVDDDIRDYADDDISIYGGAMISGSY